MLGFWVAATAASSREMKAVLFLDSRPRHVTKGQPVFSASFTAASPGCRCVCNQAGAATPAPIKTVEGTRRIALVQSGIFLQTTMFFFLECTNHVISLVLPRCCTGQLRSVRPLFFFFHCRQSAREQSLRSLPAASLLVHDSPPPLRQV